MYVYIYILWNWSHVFIHLKFSAVIVFSSLCFECNIIIRQKWFHWPIVKFTASICQYFIWFAVSFIWNFLKGISDYNSFLSFKGITHVYLLWISIAHNKNLNPLLNLLINYIFARSTPQILSINSECVFLFLIFPIIDLCNSSANSLLEIIWFLTVAA